MRCKEAIVRKRVMLIGITMLTVIGGVVAYGAQAANERLWEAARAGDTVQIAAAIEQGADVNAKARYDVTPLIFAASNGRLEAVKLLLARGADVNAQDSFYRARAIDMALTNGHTDVVMLLLQNGAVADDVLAAAVADNQAALFKAALLGKLTHQGVRSALNLAGTLEREALIAPMLETLGKLPAESSTSTFAVDAATLPRYAGTYTDADSGAAIVVTVRDSALTFESEGKSAVTLVPSARDVFRVAETDATFTFNQRGGLVESLGVVQGETFRLLARTIAETAATPAPSSAATPAPARPSTATTARNGPRNWPSFRGAGSDGNGDGQRAVTDWDVAAGTNIKWKTPIPGIANSSPIVWGDRVFVTSAISKGGDTTFRTGLYGDVKPVDDLSEHEWKIYSLDKVTGKILWDRTVRTGTPGTKRHTKSSQASSTPVTDGRHLVAVFGSAGVLAAWDMSGKELWRVDVGPLDSGWFYDQAFQWGHSSSPIIHRSSVILQADVQKGSYIAAWDLATGKPLWKTERPDEISTWGTPTIARAADGSDVVVTNGTKIRGYNATTGKLLWTLGPNSEITVGTPVVDGGLAFVTGGYPPVRPIYAIRLGASGDISLAKGQDSNQAIAWSTMTEGTYIPTPIVYNGYLFTLNNNGIVTAYNPESGQRAFRGRVGTGGSFSASPIAADGRLYITSEDGEVYVVAAAPGLAQVAKNEMKEVVMATPAISDGLVIVRTIGHLYGIGQ